MKEIPGVIEASRGLMYGDADKPTFASPTSFAEAYIGLPDVPKGSPKTNVLIHDLEEITKLSKSGDINIQELPLLNRFLLTEKDATPQSALSVLRKMVLKKEGTAKLIDRNMIVAQNNMGQLISHTRYENSTVIVHSHGARPPRDVILRHALSDDVAKASKVTFGGESALSAEYATARTNIFSPKIDSCDAEFWKRLPENAQRQYQRPITFIDFNRATALRALDLITLQAPTKISGTTFIGEFERAFVPLDYSDNIHAKADAYEIVFQLYASQKIRAEVGLPDKERRTIAETDAFAFRRGLPYTSGAKQLFAQNKIAQSVLRSHRNFGEYWPIIQSTALLLHANQYVYRGMTVEFVGTDSETVSLVYNSSIDKKMSARVVFGRNFGLPRIMHVTQNPEQYSPSFKPEDMALFDPHDFINEYEEELKRALYREDWRTRNKSQAIICNPSLKVLKVAANLELNTTGQVTTPADWRELYRLAR